MNSTIEMIHGTFLKFTVNFVIDHNRFQDTVNLTPNIRNILVCPEDSDELNRSD